jgi:hypothetical protein
MQEIYNDSKSVTFWRQLLWCVQWCLLCGGWGGMTSHHRVRDRFSSFIASSHQLSYHIHEPTKIGCLTLYCVFLGPWWRKSICIIFSLNASVISGIKLPILMRSTYCYAQCFWIIGVPCQIMYRILKCLNSISVVHETAENDKIPIVHGVVNLFKYQ